MMFKMLLFASFGLSFSLSAHASSCINQSNTNLTFNCAAFSISREACVNATSGICSWYDTSGSSDSSGSTNSLSPFSYLRQNPGEVRKAEPARAAKAQGADTLSTFNCSSKPEETVREIRSAMMLKQFLGSTKERAIQMAIQWQNNLTGPIYREDHDERGTVGTFDADVKSRQIPEQIQSLDDCAKVITFVGDDRYYGRFQSKVLCVARPFADALQKRKEAACLSQPLTPECNDPKFQAKSKSLVSTEKCVFQSKAE